MMTTPWTQLDAKTIRDWSSARGEPAWLVDQRATAWNAAAHTPVPPRTAEAWKYTNLEKIAAWNQLPMAASAETTPAATTDNAQVICTDLAGALREHPQLVLHYLSGENSARDFSAITGQPYGGARYLRQHDALWDRGLFIFVPRNVQVTTPIHAKTVAPRTAGAIFPRTIIVLESGASLTYIDELRSHENSATDFSCHAHCEIFVQDNAHIHYSQVQHWSSTAIHLGHQRITLARDARATVTNISLGGRTVKQITEVVHTAPGAESHLFGLNFGDAQQQIDHHTLQTHIAPNTTSNLLYKSALKDHARSIYTGLIHLSPVAQQCGAYQSNRNLLLSDDCSATAIPQLEIEANDVKCSHGATMGPVDADQLYYLTTRGLSKSQAEQMIVAGFFEDLITQLPAESLQEMVRAAVVHKLTGVLS